MWAWVCVRSQHRDYPRSVFPLMIPLAKLLCRGVCQQYHLLAKPSTVQRSGQRQRADSPHGGCFSPLALLPQVGSCAWGSRQPALGNRCGRGKAANPYFNLPSQKCIRLLLSHISLNVLAFSPGSQGLGLGAFNCSTGKRCLAWPPLCWAARHKEEQTQTPDCMQGSGTISSTSQEKKSSLCYALCRSFARSSPHLIQDKRAKQLRSFLWNEITERREHVQNPFRNWAEGVFTRCFFRIKLSGYMRQYLRSIWETLQGTQGKQPGSIR